MNQEDDLHQTLDMPVLFIFFFLTHSFGEKFTSLLGWTPQGKKYDSYVD